MFAGFDTDDDEEPPPLYESDEEDDKQPGNIVDVSGDDSDEDQPLSERLESSERFLPITSSFVPDVRTPKKPRLVEPAVPHKVYDSKAYLDTLAASWDLVRKVPIVPFLWQTNSFLQGVLGSSSSSSLPSGFVQFQGLPPLVQKQDADIAECPRKTLALSDNLIFTRAVTKMRSVEWPITEEANRAKAISRWKVIVDMAPIEFKIGRIILGDLATGSDPKSQSRVLEDVFAHKATKTLLARSGAFFKYIDYCNSNCFNPFPITESVIYQYMCQLRSDKAAATKAASFKSSLAFAMGMLGLAGVDHVLESARISGAVFDQLLTKRALKQRRPLLAEEVYRLEMICRSSVDIRDQVFAGFVLFLVFARVRNSDTYCVKRIFWDFVDSYEGYVQVDTTNTKTSRTISKRNRFLPCIAPRLGLSDEPWTDQWLAARAGAGLPDVSSDSKDFPLMPAPLLTGGWSKRPLNASEVRKWLGELLRIGDSEANLLDLGSHSGKATALSWMAKIGASPVVRRHLGYHVEPGEITMLTYSRDAAAEPLRQLVKMIHLIRIGHFNPDRSRSGYMSADLRKYGFDMWVEREFAGDEDEILISAGAGLGEQPVRLPRHSDRSVKTNLPAPSFEIPADLESNHDSSVAPVEEDTDSSSSDESNGVDEIADNLPIVRGPVLGVEQIELDQGSLYFHKTFCTVHAVSTVDPTRFRCGRELRAAFRKVEAITFDWPKCLDCFRELRTAP